MIGRLWRQRRRILFGMVLMALALGLSVALGLVDWPENLNGGIGALAALITLLIVVGGPTLALALVAPSSLPMIERFGLAFLAATPLTWGMEQVGLTGLWTFLALLATYFAVEQALSAGWLARGLRRGLRPVTRRIDLSAPASEVLARIDPMAGSGGGYFWTATTRLPPPDDSEADAVLHMARRGALRPAVELVYIETRRPDRLTLRLVPLAERDRQGERLDYLLKDRPDGGTRLTMTATILDAPFAERFQSWLGHEAQDLLASISARLRGRRDGSIHGLQMPRG